MNIFRQTVALAPLLLISLLGLAASGCTGFGGSVEKEIIPNWSTVSSERLVSEPVPGSTKRDASVADADWQDFAESSGIDPRGRLGKPRTPKKGFGLWRGGHSVVGNSDSREPKNAERTVGLSYHHLW